MSEVRNTLPYVSHLKVTERTTLTAVPSQVANPDGSPKYEVIQDYPGIQAEITTYMGNTKGPSVPLQFLHKEFYQKSLDDLNKPMQELDTLKAIENPTPAQNQRIAQLEAEVNNAEFILSRATLIAMLSNPNVAWVEDLMTIAGIPKFVGLWQQAFSDAMDELDTWKEPATPVGGVPIYIAPMQWDAKIPHNSNKAVDLRIGMFLRNDYSDQPTQHQISFEDTKTRIDRENQIAQYETLVANIDTRIAELGVGQDQLLNQLKAEKKNYEDTLTRLKAVESGLIKDLVQNPSVQESLPKLIMAIFAYMQMKTWPDLDLALCQVKLVENLTELAK